LTYVVVHKGGTLKENSGVVRELGLVDIGTVFPNMSTVVNLISLWVEEAHALDPIPRLLGPIGVCLVAGITGKSGTQIEKTTVSDTFLQVSITIQWIFKNWGREC
jgi:hypothetical protein